MRKALKQFTVTTLVAMAAMTSVVNPAYSRTTNPIIAWMDSAETAVEKGDYSTAISNFQRVIENRSDDSCTTNYVSRLLNAAQEANEIINKGGSTQEAEQVYELGREQADHAAYPPECNF